MDSDMDALFIIFDKFLNVIEYIENYFRMEKKEINIELGNLYTIYEDDEENDEEENKKDEFILV